MQFFWTVEKFNLFFFQGGFSLEFFPEVNECMENNGGCMHTCVDTVGSYQCECNIGFQLGPDGKTCESACGGYILVNEKCGDETNPLGAPGEKCIPSGTISSPGFPNMYPNNKHCIWNLMAPAHYKITIEFEEFQVSCIKFTKKIHTTNTHSRLMCK